MSEASERITEEGPEPEVESAGFREGKRPEESTGPGKRKCEEGERELDSATPEQRSEQQFEQRPKQRTRLESMESRESSLMKILEEIDSLKLQVAAIPALQKQVAAIPALQNQVAAIPALQKQAGAIPALQKQVDRISDMKDKLSILWKDFVRRHYHKDFGDHTSRIRKFLVAKGTGLLSDDGFQILYQERKQARGNPELYWQMEYHQKLAKALSDYGLEPDDWETFRNISRQRNSFFHDKRTLTQRLFEDDLFRLMHDKNLPEFVATYENDRPALEKILNRHIVHPEIWSKRWGDDIDEDEEDI